MPNQSEALELPYKIETITSNDDQSIIFCGLSSMEGQSWTGCVVLLDQKNDKQLVLDTKIGISSLYYDTPHHILVIGDEQGNIMVYVFSIEYILQFYSFDPQTYKLSKLNEYDLHDHIITHIHSCSSNKEMIVSSSMDGTLCLWDIKTQQHLKTIESISFLMDASNEFLDIHHSPITDCLWMKLKKEDVLLTVSEVYMIDCILFYRIHV